MCGNAGTLAAWVLTHAKHLINWCSDWCQVETDGNGECSNGQLENPREYGKEHSRIYWAYNSEKSNDNYQHLNAPISNIRTHLLPSLTRAMAITIRFRSTKTTKRMMSNRTAAMMPKTSHVVGFCSHVSNNRLKFVLTFTSVGARSRKYTYSLKE